MIDKEEIDALRKTIFLTAYRAGAAHLASALSVIDLMYVLYCKRIVRFDAASPWKEDRDRLIFSKGHGCLALYVMLNKIGMISEEELASFCQPNSPLGGEPKMWSMPGIEASTGSLGHGLSFGVGIALASKMNHWDNKIYVIIGDGECQEGAVWEAVMSAVNFKLDNLIVIMDNNKLQAMDSVEKIMSISSWSEKWKEFGFTCDEVDGHNVQEIEDILLKKNETGKPRLIIADTIKGKGISFMENVPIWHYRMPDNEELKVVMEELGITKEELKL